MDEFTDKTEDARAGSDTNLPIPANGDQALEARDSGSGERILKARAEALATKVKAKRDEDEESLQVVEFLLAEERYALELAHVREVYPVKEVTPIPCTPEFVLGVINVRSQVLSVVDLKVFFDLPSQRTNGELQVIILHSEDMEYGIPVDQVLGVTFLPKSTIQPTLPTLTGIKATFFKGVTGDRVVILDGAKLLSDPGIVVHKEVES